jgi:putative endonuclease
VKDDKTLLFVEVRLRSDHQFGSAVSNITSQKQQKLILAAQHFLQLYAEKWGNQHVVLMQF